jgi:phage baseplate assembly protein V
MRHGDSRDSANRHGVTLSRGTVESTDDTPLMQAAAVRSFHNEQLTSLERFQSYGFTSRPKSPTFAGAVRQTAEAILAFLTGNRSHGVALAVDDRRFRPNNLQEGESVHYDDQGEQVYLSRNVLVISVPSGLSVHLQTGDGAHVLLAPAKTKLQFGALSVTIVPGKVLLGSETGAKHAVQTVNGASENVFATITETDSPMTADAIAQRTQASS